MNMAKDSKPVASDEPVGLWKTKCEKCPCVVNAATPPETVIEWKCPECGHLNKVKKQA
jgi:phage FluMu protein Com